MLRLQLLLPLAVFLSCWQTVQSGAPDPEALLWDKKVPIPYIIDSEYTDTQKETIRAILKTFENNTCLSYKEDYDSPGFKLEYSLETNDKASCLADVGRLDNGNTMLNLPLYCIDKFHLQHETMHTLGFRHTQTRSDRDKYVRVDENVKGRDAFKKLENDADYGIPYEYHSIMHYGSENMRPIDNDYITVFGGTKMTFNDWKLINVLYKCSETCDTQIQCQNGGYQHPRRCTECVCPQFFNGTNCELERGPTVTLTPGVIEPLNSAFERDDELYKNNSIDFASYNRSPARIIKAPEGSRIRVTIVSISHSEARCFSKCEEKGVEIVDGDLTSVGKRFCCPPDEDEPPYSFLSTTNVVGWVVFAKPGLDFVANVTFAVEGH